jgi:hypothetical protein
MSNELTKERGQFEFTMYLNNNIIVQRNFSILGYNDKAHKSFTFKEVVDNNMDLIHEHLKGESIDYMNANYAHFESNPGYDQNEFSDKLRFSIKNGNKELAYREWDATIYPASVRYRINIRPHIYEIINKIQKCLSEKDNNLDFTYLNYSLV